MNTLKWLLTQIGHYLNEHIPLDWPGGYHIISSVSRYSRTMFKGEQGYMKASLGGCEKQDLLWVSFTNVTGVM